MTVKQVIEKFVEGAEKGKAASVKIAQPWSDNEDKYLTDLYSYDTIIGSRINYNGDVIFVINEKKYSVTTSKQQTWLYGALATNGFAKVNGTNIYTLGGQPIGSTNA